MLWELEMLKHSLEELANILEMNNKEFCEWARGLHELFVIDPEETELINRIKVDMAVTQLNTCLNRRRAAVS